MWLVIDGHKYTATDACGICPGNTSMASISARKFFAEYCLFLHVQALDEDIEVKIMWDTSVVVYDLLKYSRIRK